jgi:hypothetical protein
MPPPSPRHLAEHRPPWRLMLVAFGLTFAVAAAMVASTAFVPEEPARSLGVPPTTVPLLPTGPAPSSTSTGSSAFTIEPGPQSPPGIAPTAPGAQGPVTPARPAKPRPTRPTKPTKPTRPPPPAPDTSKPVAPTTTEPPPDPVSTVEPTTTATGLATTALNATTTTEQPDS